MSSYSSSSRKRSQRLLLMVLALGMATVSVMLLHKLREGRVFGLLLQDQDRQIFTLQLLLQRERESSKEMKSKLENTRAKNYILRTQKMELANKLTETQTAADRLQRTESEMEASIEEKQNQIKELEEKAEGSIRADLRVAALTELLKQKETEVEDMKQLQKPSTLETIKTTPETRTNSSGGTEGSNADEATHEGEWVQVQTNVDYEATKDGSVEEKGPKNVEGEAEMIKESAIETTNDQESSNRLEDKEPVAVQDREIKVTSEEPAKYAGSNGHRARRRKSRGKGRRQREAASSMNEDGRDAPNTNKEADRAIDTSKLEIPEGRQADGRSNSEGHHNSGHVSSDQRLENAQASTVVEPEVKEMASAKEQTEKPENTEDSEGRNGNKEGESEKEADGNTEISSTAHEEGSQVQESAQIEKYPQAGEAKNDMGEETGASAMKKDGGAENKEEADVNATSITEQRDASNASGEEQTQISEITTNTDDGTSISETKDEGDREPKENEQDHSSQDVA